MVGVVDGLQYDRATHTVSLMETKTRSRKSMPPADQVDSARLQVSLLALPPSPSLWSLPPPARFTPFACVATPHGTRSVLLCCFSAWQGKRPLGPAHAH